MKNIIAHDSLHRVEPTAKNQSEAKHKIDIDATHLNKSIEDDRELKKSQTEESESSGALENGLHSQGDNQQSPAPKEKPKKPSHDANHFMGGQLFDKDA